jgi:hypothetical protein
MPKTDPKFDPAWDLVYLLDRDDHRYAVIQKPEPVFGEDYNQLYVKKGCFVFTDGQWFFWELLEPVKYEEWKRRDPILKTRWNDVNDNPALVPDYIFANRINNAGGTVGHPAPRFKFVEDENNWQGYDQPPFNKVFNVPDHVSSERLDDLLNAHLLLSEYLQDGVENPKTAKTAK